MFKSLWHKTLRLLRGEEVRRKWMEIWKIWYIFPKLADFRKHIGPVRDFAVFFSFQEFSLAKALRLFLLNFKTLKLRLLLDY